MSVSQNLPSVVPTAPDLLPARADHGYDLEALGTALAGTPFAGHLHHSAEIASTNTEALEQGAIGAPHGSVYLADVQTAGRGRGGHNWSSAAGAGLYVSILLRPSLAPGDALWYSLAAGLAVLAAVRATTGLVPDLRWPNDLLFGNRKVAGILTEMHAEATRVRHLVIGVGINVHQLQFPAALASQATSLAMEGGHTTRQELLAAFLGALEYETGLLASGDAARAQHMLLTRLEAASSWVRGKRVVVDQLPGGPFEGVTAGLDNRGFLQVRTAEGMRRVLSGGVRAQER
ncbi:MAG TPA: biotin--[acetyl-CoA-carboxylase] ligase [Acidobacteriaceae bacterium]